MAQDTVPDSRVGPGSTDLDPGAPLGSAPAWPLEESASRERVAGRLFGKSRVRKIGRYELGERLGAGGMGEVWAAYDPKLAREVAIKTLDPARFSSGRARAQTIAEARSLAKLRHVNVVAVHDVIERDDTVAIVMEQVRGPTLQTWVARGELRRRDLLALLHAAGRGLAAAEAAGVAHLDFKPDNVLVDAEAGRPMVADFGLAGSRAGSEARGGTPGYAAPEQWIPDARVDVRADQFAFASTVCALLGDGPAAPLDGRPPEPEALRAHARARVDSTGLGPGQRAALRRALEHDPAARFESVAALLDRVFARPRRRRRAAALTLAFAAAAGLGVAAANALVGDIPACAGLSADVWLGGAWDGASRGAFEAALAGSPQWRVGGQRAMARLDARRRELVEVWPTVCEVDLVDRVDPRVGATRRCVERKRRQLVALSELFAEASPSTLAHAPELSRELGSMQDCVLAARTSEARRHPNVDEGRRAEIEAAVIDAQLFARNGERGRQRERLEFARALAGETELSSLRAEVERDLGFVWVDDGEVERGLEQVESAYFLALEAGDELLAADTATLLVHLAGARAGQPDRGRGWARHAQALLEQLDGDDVRRARLAAHEGASADDPARSLAHYRRAEALLDGAPEPAPGLEVAVLNGLAIGHELAGRGREALAIYEELGEALRWEYGEHHPRFGYHLNNNGAALQSVGEFERAIGLHEQARTIGSASEIPRLVMHANTNLCFAHASAGHGELGLPDCEAAVEGCRDLYASAPGSCSSQFMALGNTLAKIGRGPEALAAYQAVFDAYLIRFGEDDPEMAWAWSSLGAGHLAVGDWASASADYTRAMAFAERATLPPAEIAEMQFGLARALHGSGQDDRARPLAEAAARAYEDAGQGLAAREVEALLLDLE